jgi:DNA-directed RNA polymerase II subunit RPB1
VLGSVIQYVYGEDGVDTQSVEEQVIPLAEMSMETVYKEYALSPADVNPFLSAEVDTSPDMVEEILADRDLLVKHVFRYRKGEDKVSTPVNVARLLSKYSNPYSTKTSLTPVMVVETITAFTKEFPVNKVFHAILRFFLAPKKAIVVHRLTEEMFKELMAEIRFRYIKAQCHAGEMVGVLAAQSIGEPTTQLTLNTFHSAGTVKANATSGVPRIEELLSASANPKRPGNTAYLTPNTTKREAIAKMKEIQKTTLRDITRSVKIYYDPYPLAATTVMDEDREVLGLYEQFAQGKVECASPWVMRLELDDQEMVNRNIMDLVEVQAKIQNSMTGVDVKCVTSDRNASKLILRLEIAASLVKNPTVLRQLEDSILNSPLTGMEGIGRVFVRTLKNEMLYDEPLGGYVTKDQYVLDLEGTNLYDLFVFPGVDMTRTFSNDIHEINEVFGIETARIALYEEFNEVFSSEKVNYHHLSVLVDSMTFSGRIVPVNRFGMKKNETGVLAKSSFEETSKVMFEAAVGAEYDTMRGVSANIMFGQKPPCGTGFVDILVDESKLPEGPEGAEGADTADLDEANKALQAADVGECRIEDLSMW